jgi:hypothetical protein
VLRNLFPRGYNSGNVLSRIPGPRRLIEEVRIGGSYRKVFLRAVLFRALAAAAGLWQAYQRWQLRPVHPSDGPIASAEPQQTDLDGVPEVTTSCRFHDRS